MYTVKNWYPWSEELNPSPLESYFWIPSTYIFSPFENGDVVNPKIGVTRIQVTIPASEEYWTWLIVIPFVLLIARIVTGFVGNPLGLFSIVTELIVDPERFALMKPESISSPVSESTQIKSGAVE